MEKVSVKEEVETLLQRKVDVEALKNGKFMCQYVNYQMSPSTLVADSVDKAYEKLLEFLKKREL